MSQWTSDWNERFSVRDTPWEESSSMSLLVTAVEENAPAPANILDVGCGLGVNAYELANRGYSVSACDVSSIAINDLKSNKRQNNPRFFCMDILKADSKLKSQFDLVYDRGCLHSFYSSSALGLFSKNVYYLLKEDKIWITVSGSRDNGECAGYVKEQGLPRLTATDICNAVEPYFQIIKLEQCSYGIEKNTSFLGWLGIFKKRNINALKLDSVLEDSCSGGDSVKLVA